MDSTKIKDILKQFWFVIVVGCIFIGCAVYFAWDTNKDKLSGKTSDGKDVIFSTDKINYTADEYFKGLFDEKSQDTTLGIQQLYNLLEYEVLDSLDYTDEMADEAALRAENTESALKSTYGESYETLIGQQLVMLGYDGVEDLESYVLNMLKADALIDDYIKDHEEIFDTIYKEEEPREVSHILVKVAKDASEEEKDAAKKKMDEIKKDLDSGKKFSEVAKKSDDSSADNGGSLGIIFKSDSLVQEFKDAAWKLKEGEMSDWVQSEYGYHLIYVNSTDKKELLKNKDNKDAIRAAVLRKNANLMKEVVWAKAKELNVEIKDKDIKADLLAFIGVEK